MHPLQEEFVEFEGKKVPKYLTYIDIASGETVFRENPEARKIREILSLRSRIKKSNLPPDFSVSVEDYVGEDRSKVHKLRTYINRFEEKFHAVHLYFWSPKNSTQKTTMACAVARELLMKGFSAHFILMGQLLKILANEPFEEDPETLDILRKVRTCDFLIIDDSFDPKKATVYKSGYQIPFLDEFLRTRLEIERKATCFTSNYRVPDINTQVFGESLRQLMIRSIIDPFYFDTPYSYRNNFDPEDLWR